MISASKVNEKLPGLIANFLLDRARAARDEAAWLQRKEIRRGRQEGKAQFEWRINPKTRQPYDFSQRSPRKIPFFGSSEGFGMDYVQYRSIHSPVLGVRADVARPTINRGGSTVNLTPAKLHGKSELQETRRAGLSYDPTDQQPSKRGSVVNWDGKIRNKTTRPSYLTAPRSTQETPADKIARSMKAEPYSFF